MERKSIYGDVNQFLNHLILWATKQEDILSILLVGSYAREEARSDSDVDLVIITTNPSYYFEDYNYDFFGIIQKQQKEDYGLLTSVRVWYENCIEVEFGITSKKWIDEPLDFGTIEVLANGYKVLYDKALCKMIIERNINEKQKRLFNSIK